MPRYVDGSTQRLAQLTGDYDPDGLPHFNFTTNWGCLGVDLGANTIHDDATFVYFGDVVTPDELRHLYDTDLIAFIDHFRAVPGGGVATAHQVNTHQLDVFFVDERGRLYVSWVIDGGIWQGPVRISPAGMAPGGARLVTARQVDHHQLDVFFIGYDGALHVSWVIDGDFWQGPVGISPAGLAPPGGCLAAAYQMNNHQLDVLCIGNDGALYVSWVIDRSAWQGPVGISPPGIAPKGAGIATAHQVDDHQLDVFFIGNDGALYVSWVIDGGIWQGPVRISPPGIAPKGANVAAAHQVDNHQLDVFFIGNDGGLYVSWVIDGGIWQGPVRISPPGIAPKGANVAAAHQVDNHQLDVFFIGNDGGLYVSWVIDGDIWQGPVRISKPGVAPKGAQLAATHQTNNSQLDVIFVGNDRGANVSWVIGGGVWQGPVNVNDGIRLTLIREGNHFFPFTYVENQIAHRTARDGTPTGAFSYDGHMFVTFFHNPINGQYFSGLSVSRDPFKPQPYDLLFKVSTAAAPKFFQIAPCVINNAEYADSLPASAGDGVILFGHGGNSKEQSDGVHLAWLPLRHGQMPRYEDIRYYTHTPKPHWSPSEQDATLFFKTEGWSSISVGRIEATGQWILLNQTCGGRDFPQSFTGPIIARIADTPGDIINARPIEVFNPVRDNALGRYMHHADFPDINTLIDSVPKIPHPGFAYGPYLLNHYTTYDAKSDTATIHYLMSTGKPYQVQVMRSQISGLRG